MDDLTFLSGCWLVGVLASPDQIFTDTERRAITGISERAMSHLHRLAAEAEDREDRLREAVEVSERDALAELSAIIEAVDVAGWQTQEAKDDADVVSWVRDMAVERDRLKQLHHNKCIDAAQDAAENEVLKSRNAELKARQVRLLAALARAVAVVRYVAQMERPKDYEGTAHWQELIELIDLLKLECKPDEAADG